MTVLPSGALEIDEVQESDQGWYRYGLFFYLVVAHFIIDCNSLDATRPATIRTS